MTRTYSLALYRYNEDEPCLVLEEDEFTIDLNTLTLEDLNFREFEEVCESSAAVLKVFDSRWNIERTLVTLTPCSMSGKFEDCHTSVSLKDGKFSFTAYTDFHREKE